MKKRLYLITFCCLVLFPILASAKVVSNLYQGQVPVMSRASDQLDAAMQQAFTQVLIKVSGNSQIASNSTISAQIPNASDYAQQYSYVQAPLLGAARVSNPDATQLSLQAVFDNTQIRQLLQQANQPMLGRDRPVLLVWLAVDDGQTQQLLNMNNSNTAVAVVQDSAQIRGIPLMWPAVGDASAAASANQVSFSDVWQLNTDKLQQLSQAYNPNAILVARLANANNVWTGQWTLLLDGQQTNWQTSNADETLTLQQGMDQVVDAITQHFAVQQASEQTQVTVTINNLSSLSSYARASNYLRQLTPVSAVMVKQVNADAVQFLVTLNGSQDSLVAAMKLDNKTLPVDASDSDIQSSLNYQWQ